MKDLFTDIMGYKVYSGSLKKLISNHINTNELTIINTINPHSYIVSQEDIVFRNALINSDYLLPDGVGICYAAKILKKKNINKISGYDFYAETMSQANSKGLKILFFGSSHEILNKISKKASNEFPNITIDIYSPPFKEDFTECELRQFNKYILDSNPDILFVGLTAPKQEKLIQKLSYSKNIKLVSGIGAVFDFYSGNIKRPSRFWIAMNLEWFIRFIREPRRLFGRNFNSGPRFIYEVFKWLFRG